MVFLVLEKAFDRVPHELIWSALRSHQVLEAYVRQTQLLYQDTTSIVHFLAGISPAFSVSIGVHQGSALSPLLFIICIDTAMVNIQSPRLWTLLNADNILLANGERQTLNDQVQQWKEQEWTVAQSHEDGVYGMRPTIRRLHQRRWSRPEENGLL